MSLREMRWNGCRLRRRALHQGDLTVIGRRKSMLAKIDSVASPLSTCSTALGSQRGNRRAVARCMGKPRQHQRLSPHTAST
jgi:hypothetical protein